MDIAWRFWKSCLKDLQDPEVIFREAASFSFFFEGDGRKSCEKKAFKGNLRKGRKLREGSTEVLSLETRT